MSTMAKRGKIDGGFVLKRTKSEKKGRAGTGKFLCLAAQGNIDLTCNYWKGTREERRRGRKKQGGGDVERCRQPRSVTVQHE